MENKKEMKEKAIDRKMNKQDLKKAASISTSSIAKLGRGENITTDVLLKICKALDCDLTDIMEIIEDENNDEKKV